MNGLQLGVNGQWSAKSGWRDILAKEIMTESRSAAACWHVIARIAWLVLLPTLSTQLVSTGCSQTAHPAVTEQRVDPFPSPASPDGKTFTLVGAGDIAGCKDLDGARATAKLIEKIPGTVFAAGDLAYESGSPDEFQNCYGTT